MNRQTKRLQGRLIAFLVIALFTSSVFAKYSGGTGEPNTPYQIANVADLMTLANDANDYNKRFIMTADIDLDPNLPGNKVFTSAVIARDTNIATDVFDGNAFTGVFDGANHKILNLAITNDVDYLKYLGLFGEVNEGAVIKNLGLELVKINSGHFASYIGGLAAFNKGSIINCYSAAWINCGVECLCMGGLTGVNTGDINNCYTNGRIYCNRESYDIGGLTGVNNGRIDYSYSISSVYGDYQTWYVGGLVGGGNNGIINNCYSGGCVTGFPDDWHVGGLIGYTYKDSIENCYSSSNVIWYNGSNGVGGLAGSMYLTDINNCYFLDFNDGGGVDNGVGIMLSDTQMREQSSFAGWDFSSPVWKFADDGDYPRLWWEQLDTKYSSGRGTIGNPYRIGISQDIIDIHSYPEDWDKRFVMVDDIDMEAKPAVQVSVAGNSVFPFVGVFDGNGHTISNFKCSANDGNCVGFFGNAKAASIKKLHFSNPQISAGNCEQVGALTGYLQGDVCDCSISGGFVYGKNKVGGISGEDRASKISMCFSNAEINGGNYVGGLVGKKGIGSMRRCSAWGNVSGNMYVAGLIGCFSCDYAEGEVNECFSLSSVNGANLVGGLTGQIVGAYNKIATIKNCYAGGIISGYQYVGGLIGQTLSYSSVRECYSYANVTGDVNVGGFIGYTYYSPLNSYWDKQASGQSFSYGAFGRTTALMMDKNTYVLWALQIPGVWTINNGNDYPRLAWEQAEGDPIANPTYSGGSGTLEDPCIISLEAQIILLANTQTDWGKHFRVANNLDFSSYSPLEQSVIGNQSVPFTGTLEGDGHVIYNFHSSRGLFGYIDDANALINNLGLIEPNINAYDGSSAPLVAPLVETLNKGTVKNCYVESASVIGSGGLIGSVNIDGNVFDCYAKASVISRRYGARIGGFAGVNGGLIKNSYSECNVLGTISTYTGGFAGYNDGNIICCSSNGFTKGYNYTGGITASNRGIIRQCQSTGDVNDQGVAGGIVGYNEGTVDKCFSGCNIFAQGTDGGVVGTNGSDYYAGTITDSYALGQVQGNNAGGLVGENYYSAIKGATMGSVTRCYSAGKVIGIGEYPDTGGLVGYCNGTVKVYLSFWDINTSEQKTSRGGTGKTTIQMQTESAFTVAGWDFNNVWSICETTNYPRLIWQIPAGDIICPNGVDIFDLAEFCEQWLFEEIPADLAPPGGDGIVNFADFSVFANQWRITNDINDLLDFSQQWLKTGLQICSADIAPAPDGDGRVDAADFALMAENWLQ